MAAQIKRLFFALWPTAEISHALKQNANLIKNNVTGNFVSQSNWHITLVFIGKTNMETMACLIEQANNIQCSSFLLKFDNIDFFNKSKTLYYGVDKIADLNHINVLVQHCKQAQDSCGLISESRQFVPHITLAKKAKQLEQKFEIKPVAWQVNEFVLVASEVSTASSIYTVLNRWSLSTT